MNDLMNLWLRRLFSVSNHVLSFLEFNRFDEFGNRTEVTISPTKSENAASALFEDYSRKWCNEPVEKVGFKRCTYLRISLCAVCFRQRQTPPVFFEELTASKIISDHDLFAACISNFHEINY